MKRQREESGGSDDDEEAVTYVVLDIPEELATPEALVGLTPESFDLEVGI